MASSRARYVSILANTLDSSGKVTSNNILLPDSGVTAGSYGSASQVPILTIDSKGRVTSASTTSVAGVTTFGYNTGSGRLTINTADGGVFTADVTLAPFSTSNLAEGTNQYFTTARARASISASGSLSYNSTTGALSYTQGNTDTVAEGAVNLYFTQARARNSIGIATGSAAYSSATGVITIPGTSSHITEGTNLFYTDARARAALSGGTGVSYNNTTGVISVGQAVGTTDNVTFGNVTVNGTLTSDDITSTNVTVSGNLTVSGTTTTVNSTTVSVADINIEVARNATTAAQANGAGLTVTGPTTPATLSYSSADDRWNLNKDLNIGRVYGNLTGAVTGNASTASALQTARSITITGDGAWTVNFDGSANVSGALTLSNSGVTAGSYGSGTAIPVLTIDAKGRITSASTSAVTIGDGAMTVTAGSGLTGGGQLGTANQTGASSVTISHSTSGVTAGTYNNVTVNALGHVTSGSNVAYLTSYTETDTLATVTGRGSSTSTAVQLNGGLTSTSGSPLQLYALGSGTYNIGVMYINSTTFGFEGPLTTDVSTGTKVPFYLTWRGGYASQGGLKLTGGSSAELGGYTVYHAGNLTNLNQLSNGPGYITSESDTLASVTARGASTSTSVTLSSNGNHYSGHFYYDAYDAAGNYYPHLLSGSDGTGAKVNWRIGTGSGTYDVHYWDKNQSTFFNSVRSPIFYDSNNTGYYGDFASTSVFSVLNFPSGSQTINTGTPGTTIYQLNFTGQATADYAQAITWGWSSSGAQAGIYVQSSGAYGTKMYIATTDSFATGSKTAISIDHQGVTNFVRARPTYAGNTILDAGNYTSYSPSLTGSGASGTWGISITGNAASVSGITAGQFFNNMGNNHSTYTDFNNVPGFGAYYVQQGNNGPTGVAGNQFYGFTLGLGNEYALSSYASQLYWPRAAQNSDTYMYVRDREGGTWGSWRKTKAGYADSAGTATNQSGGSISATSGTFSGVVTFNNPAVMGGYNNSNSYVAFNNSGTYWGLIGNYSSNDWRLGYGSQGSLTGWGVRWDASGNAWSNASHRAPIFYDNDDTGYYLDPNSYSRIRQLTVTNARVDSSKYPVGHYAPGQEVFAIDPTWTQDQLREYFNSNSVSWVADSSAPGGYAIQISGSTSVGGNSYGSGFPWIPVESDDTFYMECYIKDVSGTNGHYMGSIDFDHNFSNLGGNPGSYGYWVMSNQYPGASWTKVSGYISGFGTSTGQFKTGTKYWTPQALFNYSGGGTSYISGWRVYRLAKGIVGRFPNSTTNSGEAWYGRANDRNRGTFTIQLGGGSSSGRQFEVVDYAWSSVMFSVDSGNYASAAGSFRAPLFYDSNDTSYYCDPRSTSRLSGLRLDGVDNNASGDDAIFWINKPNNSDWAMIVTGALDYGIDLRMAASHTYAIRALANGTEYSRLGTDLFYHNSNIRSPIFYNSADTSYYWDPGVSSAHRLQTPYGYLDLAPMNSSWCHFQTDRGQFYFGSKTHHDGGISAYDSNDYAYFPLYYDYNNTAYYVDPASTSVLNRIDTVRANNWLYLDNNYGHSVVGVYSSYRYQGVFAMGDAYKLPADGTTTGSLYGMAWSHPNTGGVAGNLDSHGMIVMINGGFGSCMSYSIKASGNVTAYSDERLKTNWRNMPEDYVTGLAQVKVGIYDRTDGEQLTQVGVSAQSLQKILPEAIITADDDIKTLSVNYGGAALASAVELAKKVVEQEDRIAKLEALVETLINKLGEK